MATTRDKVNYRTAVAVRLNDLLCRSFDYDKNKGDFFRYFDFDGEKIFKVKKVNGIFVIDEVK